MQTWYSASFIQASDRKSIKNSTFLFSSICTVHSNLHIKTSIKRDYSKRIPEKVNNKHEIIALSSYLLQFLGHFGSGRGVKIRSIIDSMENFGILTAVAAGLISPFPCCYMPQFQSESWCTFLYKENRFDHKASSICTVHSNLHIKTSIKRDYSKRIPEKVNNKHEIIALSSYLLKFLGHFGSGRGVNTINNRLDGELRNFNRSSRWSY